MTQRLVLGLGAMPASSLGSVAPHVVVDMFPCLEKWKDNSNFP